MNTNNLPAFGPSFNDFPGNGEIRPSKKYSRGDVSRLFNRSVDAVPHQECEVTHLLTPTQSESSCHKRHEGSGVNVSSRMVNPTRLTAATEDKSKRLQHNLHLAMKAATSIKLKHPLSGNACFSGVPYYMQGDKKTYINQASAHQSREFLNFRKRANNSSSNLMDRDSFIVRNEDKLPAANCDELAALAGNYLKKSGAAVVEIVKIRMISSETGGTAQRKLPSVLPHHIVVIDRKNPEADTLEFNTVDSGSGISAKEACAIDKSTLANECCVICDPWLRIFCPAAIYEDLVKDILLKEGGSPGDLVWQSLYTMKKPLSSPSFSFQLKMSAG